jgi:hypothetical protein
MALSVKLPSRFPVGTKFVIEGRSGKGKVQIFSRYLEFPDGSLIRLPSSPPLAPASRSRSVRARRQDRRG